MQALAAGNLGPGLEALLFEQAAQVESRVDYEWPFDAGTGVEVEHEPIGVLNVVYCGVPRMQFEDAHLESAEGPRGR